MFRFANPQYLWLLMIIPVVIVLLVLLSRIKRRNLQRWGNLELLKDMMSDVSVWRMRLKVTFWLTAVALIVLAVARPQFGSRLSEQKATGIEMMLVVDVSNSMLAEDFAPNRLDRTKYSIDKLFSSLVQDRVGLVVFAGEAKVQLPITTDYRMARSFAKKLSPSLVSVQGTDLGQAISLASMSFSDNTEVGRVMIIISDGEDHDEKAEAYARRAAEQGIRIFTIGIGSPEGAPVKIDGEFIKDENGDMVVTKLNEELLQNISQIGNGGYIRASNASFGLDEIVDKIKQLDQGELDTMRFEEFNEQFYWLLLVAFILLVLESALLSRKNPHLKKFNIFS